MELKLISFEFCVPNVGTGGGFKQEGDGGSYGQSSKQNPQVKMLPLTSNSKVNIVSNQTLKPVISRDGQLHFFKEIVINFSLTDAKKGN